MSSLVGAALLAASVAAAATADTSLRVPGTALRFGMSRAQVQRVLLAQPSRTPVATTPAAPAAPGTTPTVPLRFFGLAGEASLEFEDDALAGAKVKVSHPSPHDIDYVEDDLARQGFHRRCETREGLNRRCDWSARTLVRLATSDVSLEASIAPIAPAPPALGAGAARAAATAMPAAAAAAETLQLSWPAGPTEALPASPPPDSLPWPTVLTHSPPVRPEIARQSGVFGRVIVEVTVDSTGRVMAARVARGVPMLDTAALDCARQYRFAPYVWRGRAHPFRVALPIRFTL